MKLFLTYFFLIVGIAGCLLSVALIFEGLQPCSGDGCLIRIALFMGTILLLISSIFVFFSIRVIKKEKETK